MVLKKAPGEWLAVSGIAVRAFPPTFFATPRFGLAWQAYDGPHV